MQQLICPISNKKIPEHLPRVNAFLAILLMFLYIATNQYLILVFLIFDFLVRGFGNQKFSILTYLSKKISNIFKLSSQKIDKAPKIFAARLGGIIFIAALVFCMAGLFNVSASIVIFIGILSSLECIFSFCLGCYIYSYLILPFYNN